MQNALHLKSYADQVFEDFFEKLEREQLSAAAIQAKQDGLSNKPTSLRHYRTQIVNPLKAIIQKALDYNHMKYQPISNMAITQEQRNTTANFISLMEKEKNAKEKDILKIQGELTLLRSLLKTTISYQLQIIIAALFGGSEGVLVYNMLENASFPSIVTFFLAFVIALAAAFGLHLGANFIHKAKTTIGTIMRYVIILLPAFIVSVFLGIWRANIYADTANINSQINLNNSTAIPVSYSPWPFVVITFISFLVALAFEKKSLQTENEKKKQKMYREKTKELKKAQLEYHAIKNEIETLKLNSTIDSGSTIRQQEYACSNEQRLLTLAQQIINHYEGTNLEYRNDGECPVFFGNQINTDFKLYFSDLFNHLKFKK